jgi:hypothetical protein
VQELTISYIDLELSRELRQAKLDDCYAFRCACARCRTLSDDDPATAASLRRITCSCGGTLIPSPAGQEQVVACNSCPLVVQRPSSTRQDEGGTTAV